MRSHATVCATRANTDTTGRPQGGVTLRDYRGPVDPTADAAKLDIARRKSELRAILIAGRRAKSTQVREAAARDNGSHLADFLMGARIVCGFLPLASEPLTAGLLDKLVAAGTAVLVPAVSAAAPLDWCRYPARTESGAFGIPEPIGPRLGADIVQRADVILLPAFAVDLAGHRLGRGGGHYDRTLAVLDESSPSSPTTRPHLVAVLFDGEILGAIPTDVHDRTVTAAVTPSDGIRYFRS
jgi:5-formyltetrahydrofolate cyclo-ligase